MRVQQQRQAIALAGLRQETGLLAQNRRQTQLLTRVTRGLGGAFGAVAGVGFGAILLDVARGSVQASVRVEGFRRSLTALYGDAQIAERELDRLREVAQLPGITFEGAVAGALRLKTVGREGADAAAIITEFSNANALAGGTTQEFGRAMVGLTQILSRGQVTQEETNQILEAVPLIGNSIREAFGSIDAEQIRATLSAAGQDVNDFVDILTNQLSMGARASADSTANAFSNLQNATFELSAAFGDILSPAVNTATRGLTSFINRLAEAARGEDEFVQASELFTASLAEAEGNTENTNAAIQAYIDRLTELRTEQENLRDDTPWWRYAGDAPAEIERLTGDIELFTDALKGVPGTQDRVREAFEASRTAYQNQIGVVVDLTDQLENNRLSAGENNDAYQAAQSTLVETRTRFEELLGVMRALGLIDLPQTTDDAADSTAKLGESASEATQVYRNFTREIDTARDNVDRWQTALENASTEAEATEAYDNLMQSIMDLTALSRADAEQRTDATAFYRAERDEVKALSEAQELHGRRLRGITGDAAEAAQAQRRLRAEIHAARVAADTSAETGAMYAGILSEIASVSQRRAFVAIVERFQEQGLSLREALEEAERYIPVLQQRIPDAIETASGSLRDFSITSQDAFQASSDSVVNLTGNIIALGGEIREVIREAERLERLDFSDVNASLNEQRYFQQNPGRDVIGEDQRAAGQQGRAYILQNFPEQAAELGITPQTLGEATRATQMADQATQDYAASLNSVVGAIDELTPVIEGIFDIDISSPRSGGHLAVDTAQGVGQVLSGNPIGGIATLIRSFYEWGQPDAEALAEQHQQALERERQRVANIQAELDAYDMERQVLFSARLDFLRSGQSTFSDWTDTLQSFSDNDLVRGRQVFSEFSRAMNALNDEVNAARLGLVPLASSAAFTTFQRITAGRPAFGADLDAPTDDQEAGVVQTIGGVPVDPIETSEQAAEQLADLVDPAIAALTNLTADSAFQESIDTFRRSIGAAGATVETINEAFSNFETNVLRPRFDFLRSQILDDDGVIDAAEELALREAGVFTFSDFATPFREIADAAVMGVEASESALASFTADSAFQGNVTAFRESINAAGTTIEDVNTAWSNFVENTLRPEYERLRGLILDDDGVVSAAEELALRQAGVFTFEDFTGRFIGIKDSAIMGIQTATTSLANYVAESGFEGNVNTFKSSINEAGLTIEDVNSAWDTFVENTLRPEFNRLRDLILNDDGIIDASEELALRQAGLFTFEDFTSGFIGIKDAAVMGIQTATTALASYIAESGFEGNVGAFRNSINAAGATIEGVNRAWGLFVENVLRPEFNRIRGLILDDDGIIDATEELQLRQAGVFTFEDFTSGFIGIKDAAVMSINTAGDALTNYVDASGFEKNVGAFKGSLTAAGLTVEDVNIAWSNFVENTLRPEFNRIRGLILNDDGIIDATEELQLRQAGVFTFEDFTSGFIGIKDAAVMSINTAGDALTNYVDASGFEKNVGAFKGSLTAAGLTVEDVNIAWSNFVENTLRPEFNRIRGLILNDDGIIDATEELALRRAGVFTFEDFTSGFIGIKDSAVMGIQSTDAALANYVADSNFGENVEAFKSSINAIGTTTEDVNTAWGNFIENTLRPEFNRIRGLILDDDGIITAAEELALRQAGVFTFEDFTSGFTGIRDAALTGIQTAEATIQSNQARGARRADRFGIRTARFNLGEATSEQEFNDLFGILQTAVNTFYDNEEERIRALGLSVEETNQLLAENDQGRREELAGLSRITNTFAQDRINTEMRTQSEIEGLRDDAFENEQNRQQRLVDLEQETQNRILDIQRDANRSREDIERDFQDDIEDLRRQFTFDEITEEEFNRRAAELGRERNRDLRGIDIRTGRRQEDVGIRQGRSEAEIEATATATANAIREVLTPLLTAQEMTPSEMAMEAAMTPPAEASAMAVENTGTTAENTTEISNKLDPVTEIRDYNQEMLQVLGVSLSAHTRSAINLEALVNATAFGNTKRQQLIDEIEMLGGMLPEITEIGLATTETTTAAIQSGIATLADRTGIDAMASAGAPVDTRMMMAGEPVSAQAMEAMNVSISAQNVTVSGGNMSGEVNARITNPEDVTPDITVELAD